MANLSQPEVRASPSGLLGVTTGDVAPGRMAWLGEPSERQRVGEFLDLSVGDEEADQSATFHNAY